MPSPDDTDTDTDTDTSTSTADPLPLEELRRWVSSCSQLPASTTKTTTTKITTTTAPTTIFEWLQEGDAKAAAWQDELEANGADQLANLFGRPSSQNKEEEDTGDDDTTNDNDSYDSTRSDIDFEGVYGRIRVWTSSSTHRDGIGSKYRTKKKKNNNNNNKNTTTTTQTTTTVNEVRVIYLISEAWEGYGDILWASSRHLANQFADPKACRAVLGLTMEDEDNNKHRHHHHQQQQQQHPFHGRSVLELGAGCALPSLVAMHCGAKAVVATDLDDTNRIRCIAEAMQRNFPYGNSNNTAAVKAVAHPFRWEQPAMITGCARALQELLLNDDDDDDGEQLQQQQQQEEAATTLPQFDVICATDCLFIIHLHEHLIRALDKLLAPGGVALFAFAIHASYSKSQEVWSFVDKVEAYRRENEEDIGGEELPIFQVVETLPSVQMTPPKRGMPDEQGLVHTIRITKR